MIFFTLSQKLQSTDLAQRVDTFDKDKKDDDPSLEEEEGEVPLNFSQVIDTRRQPQHLVAAQHWAQYESVLLHSVWSAFY